MRIFFLQALANPDVSPPYTVFILRRTTGIVKGFSRLTNYRNIIFRALEKQKLDTELYLHELDSHLEQLSNGTKKKTLQKLKDINIKKFGNRLVAVLNNQISYLEYAKGELNTISFICSSFSIFNKATRKSLFSMKQEVILTLGALKNLLRDVLYQFKQANGKHFRHVVLNFIKWKEEFKKNLKIMQSVTFSNESINMSKEQIFINIERHLAQTINNKTKEELKKNKVNQLIFKEFLQTLDNLVDVHGELKVFLVEFIIPNLINGQGKAYPLIMHTVLSNLEDEISEVLNWLFLFLNLGKYIEILFESCVVYIYYLK